MSEFIRPPRVYTVPSQAGELQISLEHDILHHWEKVGAWMLKYIEATEEGISLKNIVLAEEGARWLIDNCGVVVCERDWISTQEHEHWLEFQTMTLTDEMFGIEDTGEV